MNALTDPDGSGHPRDRRSPRPPGGAGRRGQVLHRGPLRRSVASAGDHHLLFTQNLSWSEKGHTWEGVATGTAQRLPTNTTFCTTQELL